MLINLKTFLLELTTRCLSLILGGLFSRVKTRLLRISTRHLNGDPHIVVDSSSRRSK